MEAPDNNKIKEVTLLPHQIDNYDRVVAIAHQSHVILDSSDRGRGKSFTALKMAQDFGLSLCVVCPVAVIDNWKKYIKEYGLEEVAVISYPSLRGARGKTKHPLLTIREGEYYATEDFRAEVERGMLLVFDEVHNLMNETSQNKAAHCLTKTIMRENSCSRVLCLSATPCCRQRHCFPLMKIMGFCQSSSLYYYDNVARMYVVEGYGYQELIEKARKINPTLALEIYSSVTLSNRTSSELCYRLFTEIFLPGIRTSMPPNTDIVVDAKLGLYNFHPNDVDQLRRAYSAIFASVDADGVLRANISKPCKMIGMACVGTISRLTEQDIALGRKVVIFAEYHDVIEALKLSLAQYNPLVLSGKIAQGQRTHIVSLFNQTNMDYPVIICHPRVGGVGIELDDKDGRFPRKTYLIPSYYFIDSIQAAGRTCRTNTKSTPIVRIIECNQFSENTKILSSIIQKSIIVKTIVGTNSIVLPSDYPRINEEDDN
ncbi:DEAD/SNF2 DNA/RNA helicase [Cedratvirus Zaza IHUMI]|uniref:DEAD/SNF2 DNA/RNA helicase n=1 Tax=Cedratvirus Zaza IHUMI TaxID=2126979 RepID=A0A2R8FDT6_9VIRU|nr:DEAD/SNF2 DNA/RNA helicase [Cedratvirus Zaza IHUMI]